MTANSLNSIDVFDYDVILEHGLAGKFQLLICLWLCIPATFTGSAVMSFAFTGAAPRYG